MRCTIHERLERRIGGDAARDTELTAGAVESDERGVGAGPTPERVETSPPAVRSPPRSTKTTTPYEIADSRQ